MKITDNIVKTERESRILSGIVEIIKKNINPDKIILFGSRAKNKFFRNSDFDIAIDKKNINIKDYRLIMGQIKKIIGLYKIDLVFLKSVDKTFKKFVLKTGKIIYERRS